MATWAPVEADVSEAMWYKSKGPSPAPGALRQVDRGNSDFYSALFVPSPRRHPGPLSRPLIPLVVPPAQLVFDRSSWLRHTPRPHTMVSLRPPSSLVSFGLEPLDITAIQSGTRSDQVITIIYTSKPRRVRI
jgi:hypothetical protein